MVIKINKSQEGINFKERQWFKSRGRHSFTRSKSGENIQQISALFVRKWSFRKKLLFKGKPQCFHCKGLAIQKDFILKRNQQANFLKKKKVLVVCYDCQSTIEHKNNVLDSGYNNHMNGNESMLITMGNLVSHRLKWKMEL